MESAREIAPGIHRIPAIFFETRKVAVHLLIGQDRSMLIDTAMSDTPEKYIFPYMQKIGFDPARLDYVAITHSDIDHQEGNPTVRKAAPRAIFMCHNLDRQWIESMQALENGRYRQYAADHGIGSQREGNPEDYKIDVPMDITFEGGELIRLGPDWSVEIVHTPGHTWGHSGVFDHRSGTFIAGESALSTAILGMEWEPAYPPTYAYVDTYLSTIERLRTMSIKQYSGAHWPVMEGNDINAFLDQSKTYCLNVEHLILEAIRSAKSGITLKELILLLKPQIGAWPQAVDEGLAQPIMGNIQRLEAREQITRGRNRAGIVCWNA